MGRAYFPTQTVQTVLVQNIPGASDSNFLLLKVNGITYANGYRINYDRGYRLFSASVDSQNNVSVVCVGLAYGQDLPAMSIYNVEVILIV